MTKIKSLIIVICFALCGASLYSTDREEYPISSLPYYQDFDDVIAPDIPFDWSFIRYTAIDGAYIRTVTYTYDTAPNSVVMFNSIDLNGDFYLIAPPLNDSIATNTVRIRFWAKLGAASHLLSVGILSDHQDASTFQEVQVISENANQWTEYAVSFVNYSGDGKYIAFRHPQLGYSRFIFIDSVTIESLEANDLSAISIEGNPTPTVNYSNPYQVVIRNNGTSTQSNYSIGMFSVDGVELATVAGQEIASGEEQTYTLHWNPSNPGYIQAYAKTILSTDEVPANDQSALYAYHVQPEGFFEIPGDMDPLLQRIPMDMYFRNSLFECIYPASLLPNVSAAIHSLTFYNSFQTNLYHKPMRIWLGMTSQNDLQDGWIPSTALSPVFDGLVDFPSGENAIHIPLNPPFTYYAGQNLVMMVHRPMDEYYYNAYDQFSCRNTNLDLSRRVYSDTIVYDPTHPPINTVATTQIPRISMNIQVLQLGSINGIVVSGTGVPLEGVLVSVSPGNLTVQTDAGGNFTFPHVIAGEVIMSFSKLGYHEYTQTITLAENATLNLTVTLQALPTVEVWGQIVDNTGIGIAGASINLYGYADYSTVSGVDGAFSFPAVFASNSYQYSILKVGYTPVNGFLNVGTTSSNMGIIMLLLNAYPPQDVVAVVQSPWVFVMWEAPINPDSLAIRTPKKGNRQERVIGYKVFRLMQGDEGNSAQWVLLTPNPITATSFADTGFAALVWGTYRWAVMAVYPNNVLSEAAFSNLIYIPTYAGMLSGSVYDQGANVIIGAVISSGSAQTFSMADGSYMLLMVPGSHEITVSREGFISQIHPGVQINLHEITEMDFVLLDDSDSDDPSAEFLKTELKGNFPNPFNPSTTIAYSIAESGKARLDIYNAKGQHLDTLADYVHSAGIHRLVWDARDSRGKRLPSGIYLYRLQADSGSSIKKMLLME